MRFVAVLGAFNKEGKILALPTIVLRVPASSVSSPFESMNEHCSAVFAAIEKRNRARGDAKTANPQEESKLNPLEVYAGYESNSDETHPEDPSNTVENKVTQPSQKTISPKISLKDALFLQPWPKNVMQCFRKRIRSAAYPPGSGEALARNFRQKKRFSTAEEFLAFA